MHKVQEISKPEEKWQCSHDGKEMSLCPSMRKYYRAGNEIEEARGAGIFMLDSMMDLKTQVVWNMGLFFRSGKKDKGVLLNFCPWCGSDLEKNWREPVKKVRDEKIAKRGGVRA